MISFNEWKSKKLNKLGGLDPQTPEKMKVWKKVDLITLPENIPGTHCFNCKFIKGKKDKVGFCDQEQIKDYVSNRNCCSLWSAEGVIRAWENNE